MKKIMRHWMRRCQICKLMIYKICVISSKLLVERNITSRILNLKKMRRKCQS